MIAIKGMDEIPDTCGQCPLSVSLFGKIHCPYLARRVAWDKRDDKCPLVTINDDETEVKVTKCNYNDAVSREAALNALNCDVVIDGKENLDTVYGMLETFIMRIKALPPVQPDSCENTCDFERKSNDMISRQQAIDALDCINGVAEVLKSLPSAQPEKRTEERTETHACDCISRQDAIDVLNVGAELLRRVLDDADIVGVERAKYEWGLGLIESYISDMKDLPSVQPEQPQWIPCSERLPDKYGEYRMTWTTSASEKRFIGDSEYEITGEWDSENDRFKGEWLLDDYIKNYPDVKVLAWKPIEEPWRGDADE